MKKGWPGLISESEIPFWRVMAVLLLAAVFVLAVYLLNPAQMRAQAQWQSVPVSLHAKANADYGYDEMSWILPPVSMKVVEDTIIDMQLAQPSSQIQKEINQVYNSLNAPIPAVTENGSGETHNNQTIVKKTQSLVTPQPSNAAPTKPAASLPAQTTAPTATPKINPTKITNEPTKPPTIIPLVTQTVEPIMEKTKKVDMATSKPKGKDKKTDKGDSRQAEDDARKNSKGLNKIYQSPKLRILQ